jgi:ELWxxDGT repeat protein
MLKIKDLGIYVALTLASMTAMGGTPHLTLDINTQVQPRSSTPVLLGKLGSSTYFSADTTPGAIGAALFATDGTTDGTIRVKDIAGAGVLANLSTSLLAYVAPPLFFNAGAKAYFTPVESTTGEEVWVTDGTAAGTHIVKDLYPGQGGDSLMLGVVGTDLIFFESTSETNRQIFKTDGTAAGTVQLSNFPPFIVNVSDGYLYARDPVTINGKVYVGLDSKDLWVTDGTSAGTRKLGNVPSPWNIEPTSLTAFGNSLLFIGFDPSHGTVLYGVDTATDIPQVLANAQFNGGGEKTIAVMGGYALFVGAGSQLWKTDGTAGGTVAITNFSMPDNGAPPLGFQDTVITRVGSRAVFLGAGSQNDLYLWGTDGTAAGTVQLIAAPHPTNPGIVQNVIGVVGNYGYFVVSTSSGDEIVVTDGSVAGTRVLTGIGAVNATSRSLNVVAGTDSLTFIEVLDTATPANHALYSYAPQTNTLTKLREAPANGQIAQLSYDSGHVFFDSTDQVTGDEPWVSDGTVAGTHQLKNVMPESLTDDSHPASLVDFGGKVAFLADDGLNDGTVWISDGTAAGTTLLPNVTPANKVYLPSNLIGAGGALYFFAYSDDNRYHFMRVAQTADAPQTLGDLAPPMYPWSTVLNGELYFVASTSNQNALYKTDRTTGGTVALTDQSIGAPSYVYTVGNKVFFLASTSTAQQLFSTDGTSAGTVQLSHATNLTNVGGGSALPVLDGAVYFATTDTSNNVQFWKTDGTAAGTVATALFPATNGLSDNPLPIAAVNGKLLVQSQPLNAQGAPLSVSDGTAVNTTPLNMPPLGYTAVVTVIGSKAYFAAANLNNGFDPWVTDGTQAGTYMLTSVANVQYASVDWFLDFNGVTIFEVAQPNADSLLFQTDGTQAGTKLIAPIGMTPMIPAVYPREHRVIGQNLFFPAVDSSAGAELFAMTNNAPVAVADFASAVTDAAVTINVLTNDSDPDGSLNDSAIQITTNPTHGSVTIGTGGSLTYTPTAGYSGQDTFAYTVPDNQGAVSAPAQVTVSVTPSVTVSTDGDSGSGSTGGGGSIGYMDVAFLMALTLQLSSWRFRRGRYALREMRPGFIASVSERTRPSMS